jgi:hypothetical protein
MPLLVLLLVLHQAVPQFTCYLHHPIAAACLLVCAGVTRFEDDARLPLGIAINSASFAAKTLAQASLGLVAGLQSSKAAQQLMGAVQSVIIIVCIASQHIDLSWEAAVHQLPLLPLMPAKAPSLVAFP